MEEDIISESELREMSKKLDILIAEEKDEDDEKIISLRAKSLLNRFFLTAESARLPIGQRIAATNALCGLLDYASKSASASLIHLSLDAATIERLLFVYLDRSQQPQSKPMQQLLRTLMSLLKRVPAEEKAAGVGAVSKAIAAKCLALLYSQEDLSSVKPAMLVLDSLLNRNLVGPLSVISSEALPGAESPRQLAVSEPLEGFVRQILRWARHSDNAPSAGKLLFSLFQSLEDGQIRGGELLHPSLPSWQTLLQELDCSDPDTLRSLENHILPNILKSKLARSSLSQENLFLKTLGNLKSMPEKSILPFILVLKTAYKLQTDTFFENLFSGSSDSTCVVQLIASRLSIHSSLAVRSAALDLLTYSRSPAEPLSSSQFSRLQRILPVFHSGTDPKSRGELTGIVRRLCVRLQHVILKLKKRAHISQNSASRSLESGPEEDKSKQELSDLKNHIDFVRWYYAFSIHELRPTSSYQRHVTALKALELMMASELPRITETAFYNATLLSTLLDLTLDAFDDTRNLSTSVIRYFPSSMILSAILSPSPSDCQSSLLQRADTLMCKSGRADVADGFGRVVCLIFECSTATDIDEQVPDSFRLLEDLLFSLEKDCETASRSISAAVASAPLHGRLIALRYIISRPDFSKAFSSEKESASLKWRAFHNRLQLACTKTWEIVKGILCIDSPEGSGDAEEDDAADIGVKDTLSFAWRSLKESSSLAQAMMINPHYGYIEGQSGLLTHDLAAIGNLSILQLAELRHRGAFSTVSQTFAACCIQCASRPDTQSRKLLDKWYQQTLSSIQIRANALTRRSAGLPAMMSGLLVARSSGEFFDNVMHQLRSIAVSPVDQQPATYQPRLPQVHALNCLKDIFINTRLGPSTERHLEDTILLAVDCLNHPIWPIRNCGVMLFNSLIVRLCSPFTSSALKTTEAHRRFVKATYNKYPKLRESIVRLLNDSLTEDRRNSSSEGSIQQVQIAFPAMEILERIGAPMELKGVVDDLLDQHLGSPVWNIRSKAAQSLSNFRNNEALFDQIEALQANRLRSQNVIHGQLLCLRYQIEKAPRGNARSLISKFRVLSELGLDSLSKGSIPITTEILKLLTIILSDTLASGEALPGNTSQTLSSLYLFFEAIRELLQLPEVEKPISRPYLNPRQGLESIIAGPLGSARMSLVFLYSRLTKARAVIGELNLQRETSFEMIKAGLDVAIQHPRPCTISEAMILTEFVADLLLTAPAIVISSAFDLLAKTISVSLETTSLPSNESPALLGKLKSLLDQSSLEGHRSPDVTRSALQVYGAAMPIVRSADDGSHERLLFQWGALLNLALRPASDVSMRHAAIQSIELFCTQQGLRSRSALPYNLTILAALYDGAEDDDEEVREHAAYVTSMVISAAKNTTTESSTSELVTPLVALEILISAIFSQFSESNELKSECIRRVIGLTPGLELCQALRCESNAQDVQELAVKYFRQVFREATLEDNSLFVVEKQNLFVDDVQEIERWAKQFWRITPTLQLKSGMDQIARHGLQVLLEHVSHGSRGPLSWSSKPLAYTAGSRVLLMVEISLRWSLSMSQAEEATKLKGTLNILKHQPGMHWLWDEKVETMLALRI